MAALLSSGPHVKPLQSGRLHLTPTSIEPHFWAVDKVILSYFVLTTVLILGWWSSLPSAPLLLLCHIVGVALLVFEVKRPNRTSWVFRNWYPLPYVGLCYKEMALLIPAIWRSDADRWLADLDFRFWRAHPTVWLERIHTPALTELLQIAYTLFIPVVLFVAALLWRRRQFGEFQYYAFIIALGFLTSYIGYVLVPARGPRFLLESLQSFPLHGLWFFERMQSALDVLESAHYDCFPSGHTELTLLALWGSRMVSKTLFSLYLLYTPFLIFATVYLRYHYSVDVLAGMAVAAAIILAGPFCYRKLSKGER